MVRRHSLVSFYYVESTNTFVRVTSRPLYSRWVYYIWMAVWKKIGYWIQYWMKSYAKKYGPFSTIQVAFYSQVALYILQHFIGKCCTRSPSSDIRLQIEQELQDYLSLDCSTWLPEMCNTPCVSKSSQETRLNICQIRLDILYWHTTPISC